MRAIVQDEYGPPGVLRMDEVDVPEPGPEQVRVRVHASSINMADVDYLLGRPRLARVATGWGAPKNRIPGTDMSGTIDALGDGVTRWSLGDEVFADLTEVGAGAFAEWVVVPADALTRKPANLDFAEAAAIPSSAILGWQGMARGEDLHAGARVLVNGAGGNVGPFVIQLALAHDAEVDGVDSAGKLALLESLGCARAIDFDAVDYTRGESRYDLIVDMASYRSLWAVRQVLAPSGRYMMVGGPLRRFLFAPLMGLLLRPFSRKRMGIPMWQANHSQDMERMLQYAEEGVIRPVITQRFGLEGVPEAMRRVMAGASEGKVVIEIAAGGG
jgi:NADPH:quinone reductase-like Zn-dependent oxidoreductase